METLALIPALSPWERETRSPSIGETGVSRRHCVQRKTSAAQVLFPLPGGEGQGEGERHTNLPGNIAAATRGRVLLYFVVNDQ